MKYIATTFILLFVVLLAGLVVFTEAFQSAGTLLQLQTSHVPTEEDVMVRQRLRRRIHRDLLDMTGSY